MHVDAHEATRLPGRDAGVGSEPDVVEAALAAALQKAANADEWAVVAKLAAELEARRRARSGAVDLEAVRQKRVPPADLRVRDRA